MDENNKYLEKVFHWYLLTLFTFVVITSISELIAHFILRIPNAKDIYAQIMIIGLTIISGIFEIIVLVNSNKNESKDK